MNEPEPVPEILEEANYGMPVYAAPEFAAGFVYKFVGENNLSKIETCYQGGKTDGAILENAIKDFMNGDSQDGIAEIKNFAAALPGLLSTCEEMTSDLAAIEAWAQIFKNKTELIAKISKAMLLHHRAMTKDINTIKSDWAAKQYYQAGQTAADLAEVALGPVTPTAFLY